MRGMALNWVLDVKVVSRRPQLLAFILEIDLFNRMNCGINLILYLLGLLVGIVAWFIILD